MRLCPQMRLLGFALALLLCAIAPATAQNAKCAATIEPQHIFVTIGIDQYQHVDKWPLLHSAVNDAKSLEHVLETKFGYQSYESLAKTEPLRNEKATRDAINTLVQDDLKNILCDRDDFILFFSGHGTSTSYQNGNIKGQSGYLVPWDAREQGVSSLIEVKAFLENVSHLPARHILVILDACNSGIAIQDALQGMRSSGDYQAALASRNSRKVIVSAQGDQTASDRGSIPDHSLFGGLLLQALDQGLAAKDKSFIADSQLAEFLKENVSAANRDQLPDSAPFIGNDGGALVLQLDQGLAGIYLNAMHSLMTGDEDSFRDNTTKASQRSPYDPQTLVLQYRYALLQNRMDNASTIIGQLHDLAKTSHIDMPLSGRELTSIQHQVDFWRNALQIPVLPAPPNVMIRVSTGETEQHRLPLSGSNEFSVPAEANLYFELRARTKETYVYVFLVDKLGRIQSQGDFLRQHQNPVDANSWHLSTAQIGPELNDLQEWHFIFSPRPIDEFLSPPSDTSLGGSPATADELAGASHYVITIRPE